MNATTKRSSLDDPAAPHVASSGLITKVPLAPTWRNVLTAGAHASRTGTFLVPTPTPASPAPTEEA